MSTIHDPVFLQPDMVLYTEPRWSRNSLQKITITRVTPKRAFSRVSDTYEIEFDRVQPRSDFIHPRGADYSRGSYPNTYAVETPELTVKYQRQRKLAALAAVKWEDLPEEVLDKVLEAVK